MTSLAKHSSGKVHKVQGRCVSDAHRALETIGNVSPEVPSQRNKRVSPRKRRFCGCRMGDRSIEDDRGSPSRSPKASVSV